MIDEFREWQSQKNITAEEVTEFLTKRNFQVSDIITHVVADLVNLEKRISEMENKDD